MKKELIFCALAMCVISIGASAQCGDYAWPADKAKAEKYVETYEAAIKDQNYKGATAGIQWMLANAPKWHEKLYVEAVDVYDKLAEQELDPSTKQVYADSILKVYDIRLANKCGEESDILNYKAYYAYKYSGREKSKVAQVLAIFDHAYEVNGNEVMDNNLIAYMNVIRSNADMLKNLNEDQIMQRYNKLLDVISAKIKTAETEGKQGDIGKYKKVTAVVDATLAKTVDFNCAFAKKYFEPKFTANPADVELAKKIYTAMLNDKCTSEASFIQAAELIHKTSPNNFDVTKELASAYINTKNFDKAAPLLTELQGKATKPAQKAWITILNGDIEFQKGNKAGARDLYKKVLTTDPANKDAHEHWGDLYMASVTECAEAGSFDEKLVYIAAYELYKKSGDIEKMKQAYEMLPTNDEIQKSGWPKGQQKKIGCWINESVSAKARASQD